MSASSPEYSIEEFIRQLQKSNVPASRWIATSLDELYLHDEGSLARVKGPDDMNLKYTPRALRVIGLHEGEYIGLGVALSEAKRAELRDL